MAIFIISKNNTCYTYSQMIIGYIYKIINIKTNKFYIGSTINFEKRKKRHISDLRKNKHHCLYLQNAYNKYGENAFIFKERILQIKNKEELLQIEERYINFCWKSGMLYNVSKKGSGGDLISYHPNIEEIKKKTSFSLKKMWKSKSVEEKKEYAEKKKGKGNPNYGHKWNKEKREKQSRTSKEYYKTHNNYIKGKTMEEVFGKEKAQEIKMKISNHAKLRTKEKNPFYGKHHSDKTKKLLSKIHKGKTNISCRKKVKYNGVIYDSVGECAKINNLKMVTVAYRCRNNIYGFSYVGENDNEKQKEAKEMWTYEKCEKIAKKYKTKNEFTKCYPGAVSWLRKNGLWENFSKQNFIELRHKWTLDEIKEIAKKYSCYSDFYKNEKRIINIISRHHKWRDEIKKMWIKS